MERTAESLPWTDEIVAEVRAARERLLAECNYDLRSLAQRMRADQAAAGRTAQEFPRRQPPSPSTRT